MQALRKVFIIFLLVACGPFIVIGQSDELIRRGFLDLQNTDHSSRNLIELNGEWEFYWNQLLEPGDFLAVLPELKPSGFIQLPGFWNGMEVNQAELSGKGFATLRLQIANFFTGKVANIIFPHVNSAYRLFINGSLLQECGTVGMSAEESAPRICPKAIGFSSKTDQVEIILQISNFRQAFGGLPQKITLGEQSIADSITEKRLAFDLLIVGALLVTGFYYLGIYWVRKQERFAFYFGLFCLFMSLRTSYLNTNFIVKTFPDINWLFLVKMDFISLAMAPVLFATYLYYFYPKEFSRLIHRSILSAGALLVGVSIFSSSYLLTKNLLFFQILVLFTCIYSFYIMTMATIRKRDGSIELLIGCLILVLTVLNDVLHAQSVISTAYVAGLGLLFFLVAQSFVFTKRFSTALRVSHELSVELEIKVKDQTSEIRDLLDNTGQGILSFDEALTIQQHASRAAFMIFQKKVFGENILELMFSERYDEMAGYMEIIFKSGGAMRLVKDMLPKEFKKNERTYDLEYRWIPPGKKTPAQVMLILTDVTTRRKLQKMLEKDELRNQKIIGIAVDRHGFLRFFNGVQNRLNSVDQLLKDAKGQNTIIELSTHFHTIKGGLSSYSFFGLAEFAHSAEDLLEDLIRKNESLNSENTAKLLNISETLRAQFRSEVFELGDLVPSQFLQVNSRGFYTIAEEKIECLEQMLTEKTTNDPELKAMLTEIKKQPLRNTVKKLSSDAKYIAYQQRKQIEVKYSGEDTQIIHAKLETFLSNLTHLVRNAVHHGIEPPIERKKLGKPETGTISIDISLKDSVFRLVFADDGKGIATSALKQRAVEKGLLDDEKVKSVTKSELLRMILLPSFSTAVEVSTFSGRGIGMHALASSVSGLGGTIEIESQTGQGTTFSIAIPVSF